MSHHIPNRPRSTALRPPPLSPPITYLITDGLTTRQSTTASAECQRVLALVAAAVAARLSLVQIREKNLTARTLWELTAAAARLTRDSATRLLVNERVDVALAAGADGVHLPGDGLTPAAARRAAAADAAGGETDFLIGVSTHSVEEAVAARGGGASFAVFGPVYATPSKARYNSPPLGVEAAAGAVRALADDEIGEDNHRPTFPLLGLGGVTAPEQFAALARAGMSGVAGIRLFADAENLTAVVRQIAEAFGREQRQWSG